VSVDVGGPIRCERRSSLSLMATETVQSLYSLQTVCARSLGRLGAVRPDSHKRVSVCIAELNSDAFSSSVGGTNNSNRLSNHVSDYVISYRSSSSFKASCLCESCQRAE